MTNDISQARDEFSNPSGSELTQHMQQLMGKVFDRFTELSTITDVRPRVHGGTLGVFIVDQLMTDTETGQVYPRTSIFSRSGLNNRLRRGMAPNEEVYARAVRFTSGLFAEKLEIARDTQLMHPYLDAVDNVRSAADQLDFPEQDSVLEITATLDDVTLNDVPIDLVMELEQLSHGQGVNILEVVEDVARQIQTGIVEES